MQLIRVRDGAAVPALLLPLSTAHINDFRTFWRPRLRTLEDEDQYWDWEQKQRIYLSGDEGIFEGYVIECEQMTQGLMLLQTQGHRSQVEPDRLLVYHSLATAPWNRVTAPDPNGFRAVGRVLLKFARFRSEELGSFQIRHPPHQRLNRIEVSTIEILCQCLSNNFALTLTSFLSAALYSIFPRMRNPCADHRLLTFSHRATNDLIRFLMDATME
ncbi:MAG: hypothetical protein KME10_10000 [Plectolyngbya sp. WJT66-NPBG17]|nr:hypothetical protein [Plectolyngbya sp. WJT66-NPBG17]